MTSSSTISSYSEGPESPRGPDCFGGEGLKKSNRSSTSFDDVVFGGALCATGFVLEIDAKGSTAAAAAAEEDVVLLLAKEKSSQSIKSLLAEGGGAIVVG